MGKVFVFPDKIQDVFRGIPEMKLDGVLERRVQGGFLFRAERDTDLRTVGIHAEQPQESELHIIGNYECRRFPGFGLGCSLVDD